VKCFKKLIIKKESGFLEGKNQWKVHKDITRVNEFSISDQPTYIILGFEEND